MALVSTVNFIAGEQIKLESGFRGTDLFKGFVNASGAVNQQDYCMGIEYRNGAVEAVYFSDGRVKYTASVTEYQYILADYQGNNRVLFKDNGSGVAQEIESYDYYPYGAIHGQESEYEQKYLFGGKELQTELDLGWSDFGVRHLDNWSGKWLGVDILGEIKPSISLYTYGLGNPVRFSDPSGMIEEDENGLMTVSTSKWGRDATGGENSGETLGSNFLSERQLERDLTTYAPNEGSGNDWEELTADSYSQLTGYSSEDIGRSLERTWTAWAQTNPAFIALGYRRATDGEQYFAPNWGRRVSFDGKSTGYDINNKSPQTGNAKISIEQGVAFYEVKKANASYLRRGHKNIGGEIDAINHNFSKAVKNNAAFYYLITTANVNDVSDIREYAHSKNLTFGHYVPYFRFEGNQLMVKFKARTAYSWVLGDFNVVGGNQQGVTLQNPK